MIALLAIAPLHHPLNRYAVTGGALRRVLVEYTDRFHVLHDRQHIPTGQQVRNWCFPSGTFTDSTGTAITSALFVGYGTAFTPTITSFNGRTLLSHWATNMLAPPRKAVITCWSPWVMAPSRHSPWHHPSLTSRMAEYYSVRGYVQLRTVIPYGVSPATPSVLRQCGSANLDLMPGNGQ